MAIILTLVIAYLLLIMRGVYCTLPKDASDRLLRVLIVLTVYPKMGFDGVNIDDGGIAEDLPEFREGMKQFVEAIDNIANEDEEGEQ